MLIIYKNIPVTLDTIELVNLMNHAIYVRDESERQGLKDAHGYRRIAGKKSAAQIQLEGAIGEYVVYKYFGLPFEGRVNNFKQADIGTCVQIRFSTRCGLIFRQSKNKHSDNPNHYFVLVTGQIPRLDGWSFAVCPNPCTFFIRGYIQGLEVLRHPEWLSRLDPSRPPQYCVQWEHLRPIDSFLYNLCLPQRAVA